MTPRERLYVRFQHLYAVSIYLSIPLHRHGDMGTGMFYPNDLLCIHCFSPGLRRERFMRMFSFFAQYAVFTVQYTPIAKNHEQHSLKMCHVTNALIWGQVFTMRMWMKIR